MRYKQVITIKNSIDGIFKLPCVVSCHKEKDGSHVFAVSCINYFLAYPGDRLCEDYDGKWWVESDVQNKQIKK